MPIWICRRLLLLVFLLPLHLLAQDTGQWTWMGGASTTNQTDVYGTQGVPSTSNFPGARQFASSWVDHSGNLWLFGGQVAQPNGIGAQGYPKDDLWEYRPGNETWTWVSGAQYIDQPGVYGNQGVAAPTNTPGARWGAATWTDKSGNLWLFGGEGYDSAGTFGDLNDLWEFTPATGMWTWVSGSDLADQPGVYGTQGVSDPANVPGARDSAASWIDPDGNLWIFGGNVSNTNVEINDLWKFDPVKEVWTWVWGSSSPGQYPGVNGPSARSESSTWVDANGNFWLFGGVWGTPNCAPVCGGSTLNDLWEYSPTTGSWKWVTGSGVDSPDHPGSYGTEGLPASGNTPGSRVGAVSWTDSSGNLWLFGGAGQDATSVPGVGNYLNDLWMFNPSTGLWTWVSGSNAGGATGDYGTLGIPSPTNSPGGKAYASGWIDSSGNLWLFGGQGWDPHPVYASNGLFNDLWRFQMGIAPVISNGTPVQQNPSGQSVTGPSQSSTSKEGQSAEPISTGSGNYFYQHTDFAVAARGMPLLFERTYNSLDDYSGPLGANWNESYGITLSQTSAGVASIRWGDGHGETYTLKNGIYVPQAGVYNSLVANQDGTFTLTKKNRMQYDFSSTGKLTAILDKNGNTISLTYDANGDLVTITAAGGRSLTLSYDTQGHIVSVTDPMGHTETYAYDDADDLVSATDPLGGVTKYAYDSSHHVTQITLPNGNILLQNAYDSQGRVTSQTNGRGFTWQFAYDTPAAGQTTITDARGNKTIHTYDSSLRIVGITDALANTTSYAYDSNNNQTSVTNQNGDTTSFSYDANGNVTGITDPLSNTTAFTYDTTNDLLSVTNPKGKTTTFTYDSGGDLTGIQDALGDKTALAYDSLGELISRTDAKGNSTTFTYDETGDLAGIKDALGNATTLAYDGDGRLVSVTDPNDHTATSVYDALGRLTKISDPLGDATSFSYDGAGNLLSVTDADGHTTSYAYDGANNLTTVTDALGHATTYAYDDDNNRIGFTNAKGNTTTYQYGPLNRLVGVVDPLSLATSYSYDNAGNVVAITDAKGQTNHFTYDALNRLISIAYADQKDVAYHYDADGNRTSMVDWTGTTSYKYDDLDRLISVTFPGDRTVSYDYDPDNLRASITYPTGNSVAYSYDTDERLSEVTDWLSHVTKYTYDPAGNLLTTQYPNNARIDYAYDAANRLTSVVNAAVGVPPLSFMYTLDPVGNRTVVREAGVPTYYGYDALNQLTSAQTWFLKTTWTYDVVGNRLRQTSPPGTTNYSYDAADRLIKAGLGFFTYDADGNETSETNALTHAQRTFTFDAANRLVAVDGRVNTSFVYDGDGNRVSQTVGSWTQQYVNDVSAALPVVLQDAYNAGSPSSYVYGLNLIEALRGSDKFYQYDGLGSVVQLTDAAGTPEVSYLYDAWGNSLLPTPTANSFRFAGQTLDFATGLYYMRARYYDPVPGRFIKPDVFSGVLEHPQTLNRYEYANNNPVRFIDPSGFCAILACGTNNPPQGLKISQLAGSFTLLYEFPNLAPGPAFNHQVINTLQSVLLGPELNLAKETGLGLYTAFNPNTTWEQDLRYAGSTGAAAIGAVSQPWGTLFDVVELVAAPEVAK